MSNTKMTLVDWLDDLCVRFIVNLPNEELQSVERICFQIEEAQWFYEDFIRPLDPNNLPSMHLRKFSQLMFQHCPLFSAYSEELHQQAYDQFLAYKIRVPVRGAIMLNQDMTKAVLVKGWKKGAKWSFPRGKINKEETDLDCAVREVWEETGHDLRVSDLVLPDEEMKKITVTMREQSMMLYVFRGVPEDYPFEPQTRKEISKIDWYKLTDLPTLRRKNQAQQQIPGQDMIKESSFYMVAPFLGPLKAWIKQQHKLDRQRVRSSTQYLAPAVGIPITDDEDTQAETYELLRIAPIPPPQPNDTFADLVARLSHRPSDALPEVSAQQQPEQPDQSVELAEELKRLLSVGPAVQSPPIEAPSIQSYNQQPQANPLLALFQQNNSKPESPQPSLPRTPFDQYMSPPVQPRSPHGQHHPRPPQMNNMGPPPPFGFPPCQGPQFHGPQPPFSAAMHPQMPPHFMPPPPHPNSVMFQQPQQMPNQNGPRAFQQTQDGHALQSQSFHSSQSQSFGAHGPGPAIPPASKLPAPNLNAHKLGLLNSFKVGGQQSPVPTYSQAAVHSQSPQMAPPVLHHPLQHHPNELASPHFQSPPLNIQPAQPKPRSAHQDSLLTLFRNAPPIASPEPAELSAHPTTPGNMFTQLASKSGRATNPSLLDMFGSQPQPGGITSATVRGPVNAPDFDTMKKNTHPVSGSSRGPSPAFVPQQILKRVQSVSQSPLNTTHTGPPPDTAEIAGAPQTAFKPQILKRPQQGVTASPSLLLTPTAHSKGLLDMFKSPSPQPAAAQSPVPVPTAHTQGLLDMFKSPSPQPPVAQSPVPMPTAHAQGLLNMLKGPSPSPQPVPVQSAVPFALSPAATATQDSFDRRESFPSDQKNTLLALFGSKPSPKPEGPRIPATLQQRHSPLPSTRSPLPPTPKSTMSGLISPVSPLQKGSQNASPADFASRSRISSIGDVHAPPSIIIPPTSHPATMGSSFDDVQSLGSAGGLGAQGRSSTDGKSPVDKAFLLGFLSDVARRGR
ncbi:hypothetical protein CC86DRAFT_37528 [Ophiobolus disseminans]|uniref:Nudix hydrolase domain-containing protein n=1 Tax=Ophiobolus disseminans TaxID=1469910 RepID=A0A6A6ZZQ5_9PLEO|nr:hypothetical protein CC86DRAFT_37528 [Ophiobolus disseminans]